MLPLLILPSTSPTFYSHHLFSSFGVRISVALSCPLLPPRLQKKVVNPEILPQGSPRTLGTPLLLEPHSKAAKLAPRDLHEHPTHTCARPGNPQCGPAGRVRPHFHSAQGWPLTQEGVDTPPINPEGTSSENQTRSQV